MARATVGRDVYFGRQVRRPVTHVGGNPETGYGGWALYGGALSPESVVYSVGIGDDVSFDLDLVRRYGVRVHAFNPTPEALRWLERQTLPSGFVAHGLGLAGYDGVARFHAQRNPEWISHSVFPSAATLAEAVELPVRRLRTLMDALGHDRVDVLKMDIEGSEYDALDEIVRSGADVRQLLVEFHHRFDGVGPERTRRAVEQLNAAGFRIFHVSARGEEYSFVRV